MKTLQRIHSQSILTADRQVALLLGIALSMVLLFSSAATAEIQQHEIQVDFSFDTQSITDKQVTGYRLYKEGASVCETGPVDPQNFSCVIDSDYGTFDFTIAALYDDLSESPISAPFAFTISDTTASTAGTCADTSGSKTFTLSWEAQADTSITAHRFYINGQYLCESTDLAATSVSLNADLLNEIMYFSMSSVDDMGVESSKSNILAFDPADYPELFSQKLITFFWQYDTTTAAGYKVYHNSSLLCETTDPAARQLACEADLADANIFTITALQADGSETTISNSIIYTPDTTTADTTTLAATIATSATEGVAPFTPSFDGTGSTGSISSYTWSFGDGDTSGASTVQHTYNLPGTYTATLTVADSGGTTDQASVVITATESTTNPPTTEPEQPTAVIASSTAVGEAPFSVDFDGSGSSTKQPPITTYSWDFGDGSSATGATVSHTFTVAGTYETTLTVTDSAGLSDSTGTPVLISQPDVQENQPPAASISLTPALGTAPLSASFNGSGSTDSDGTITEYLWNFGDGSSANGVSAQHTFDTAAEYTVTLQVTDDSGQTAMASAVVTVIAKEDVPFAYELGELELNHQWNTVNFEQSLIDPVVIAGPPSYAGAQPTTTRIRNSSNQSFDIRLQEWDYLDGSHANELVSFFAMEKGAFILPSGAKIEAGTFTASSSFAQVPLQQSYDTTPVILTQVISENGSNAVTGRVRKVSNSSFDYLLQEQETTKNKHPDETVAYIAWQPGTGELSSNLLYEAKITTDSITHKWADLTFQNELPTLPFFLADMQTQDGGDTATLRMQNSSTTSVQIKVEEEQSKDNETDHTTEVIGYLIFAQKAAQDSTTNEKQLTFRWTFEPAQENTISGFRIYNNNTMICEANDPSVRQVDCITELGTNNDFSIQAFESADSESYSSNTINYTP